MSTIRSHFGSRPTFAQGQGLHKPPPAERTFFLNLALAETAVTKGTHIPTVKLVSRPLAIVLAVLRRPATALLLSLLIAMAPVCLQSQNSGWRIRSQQAHFTRHERAVAKGFYKPKPLKEAALQGDYTWKTFKESDNDKISKRWADVTDLPVAGDLVPNSFEDVCDVSVDAIVDMCPPPPPRELPPMDSGARHN